MAKIKINKTLLAGIMVLIIILGIFSWVNKSNNDSYLPVSSVGADENYGKDFETYESGLGFSFKYPPHLIVESLPKLPTETTDRIIIRPVGDEKDITSAIIISISLNNENVSAEEWLLGPTSGLKDGDEYHKTTIGGQNAVYTDGGMWTVVNTPDNKYRLSIADLTIGDTDRLFTEMGIVIESLVFKY